MKIRMLQSLAGSDFALAPGDETERFSDKEARRFITAGIAEAVTGKVETADKKSPGTETR